MKAQRLRFRYAVDEEASRLGHREMVEGWEAACKAAGLPISYSEGKRASPQISMAAPLPFGVTSECELIDVFPASRTEPEAALDRVGQQLREGVRALAVEEIGLSAPSLQSQVRWAEYAVGVPIEARTPAEVDEALKRLLAKDSLPAEYRRENRSRSYDLRPLIISLWLEGEQAGCRVIGMRLRAEPEMTGRADQVILALALPEPKWVHRRRIFVEENQAAVLASRGVPTSNEI